MPVTGKQEWILTQEAFDLLLDWLSPDREQAGRIYEQVRCKLIRIFAGRGCFAAEDMADETINRVAKKVHEISDTYVGDPSYYFYGVAQYILLEHSRKKPVVLPPPPPVQDSADDLEQEYECLEKCMQHLPERSRELVIEYYLKAKSNKSEHRRELAQRLGIALNALRIRAFRIRATLQDCVRACLRQNAPA
ncbi:MAG: sigma-70 family RNA polymerase sigma factor [Pyrinomonadaceae bacterium]|nr:sigma-70 family RNA polymerase sigma factor [Pyrinomonadaceae bacterium]